MGRTVVPHPDAHMDTALCRTANFTVFALASSALSISALLTVQGNRGGNGGRSQGVPPFDAAKVPVVHEEAAPLTMTERTVAGLMDCDLRGRKVFERDGAVCRPRMRTGEVDYNDLSVSDPGAEARARVRARPGVAHAQLVDHRLCDRVLRQEVLAMSSVYGACAEPGSRRGRNGASAALRRAVLLGRFATFDVTSIAFARDVATPSGHHLSGIVRLASVASRLSLRSTRSAGCGLDPISAEPGIAFR